jgi:hypothetical protein
MSQAKFAEVSKHGRMNRFQHVYNSSRKSEEGVIIGLEMDELEIGEMTANRIKPINQQKGARFWPHLDTSNPKTIVHSLFLP